MHEFTKVAERLNPSEYVIYSGPTRLKSFFDKTTYELLAIKTISPLSAGGSSKVKLKSILGPF